MTCQHCGMRLKRGTWGRLEDWSSPDTAIFGSGEICRVAYHHEIASTP